MPPQVLINISIDAKNFLQEFSARTVRSLIEKNFSGKYNADKKR
jgi:hypothetical protein